jgi:hypothetical protein
MAAIGIGLVWAAYTAGLYGYCLFRGYNVTPAQLLSSTWPPGADVQNAGKGVGAAIVGAGKAVGGK